MRRLVALALASTSLTAASVAGCDAGASPQPEETATVGAEPQELSVFAAASLTQVLDGIASRYEADHPGVHVRVHYGGSADLAAQLREGAPADVFASANATQMDAVADLLSAEPAPFATNHLAIAVPAGNPADVTGLADLQDPAVVSVICAPQVPCGATAAELARLDSLRLAPASEEQSVTDVLGKVASGQADAGVVYATDIARAEGVEGVAIAGAERALARYPIAPLDSATQPALARDFVEYMRGPAARAVLDAAGFGAP